MTSPTDQDKQIQSNSVRLTLRMDWSEMDLFGHINNVSYFKYIQAGRVNYWDSVSLMRYFDDRKIGPILASTECRFLCPLHYPGNIVVETSLDFIRNTSFGLVHRILNEDNKIAAEARDVIVMFDFTGNHKVSIPEDIRAEMEREG